MEHSLHAPKEPPLERAVCIVERLAWHITMASPCVAHVRFKLASSGKEALTSQTFSMWSSPGGHVHACGGGSSTLRRGAVRSDTFLHVLMGSTALQVEVPPPGAVRRALGVRGARPSREHRGRLAGVHGHPERAHHSHLPLPGQPGAAASARAPCNMKLWCILCKVHVPDWAPHDVHQMHPLPAGTLRAGYLLSSRPTGS